jgi:two-component system response regulator YesN
MEKGDERQSLLVTREIVEFIRKSFSSNFLVYLENYHFLISTILSVINQNNLSTQMGEDLEANILLLSEPEKDWEKMSCTIIAIVKQITYICNNRLENESQLIIQQIQQYVHENIGGELSLSKIAEKVHMNPSYISRLYKQITGCNLFDYINEVKILEAKKMLEDEKMLVYEIGERLGFESPSYFAVYFRRMTGKTPTEYRSKFFKL